MQLDAALAYLAKLGAQPLDNAALEDAAGVGVVVCDCLWFPSRPPCQLANAGKCWGCMHASVVLHTSVISTVYTLTPPAWGWTRVQLLCYTTTVVQVQGPGYIDVLA